MPFRLLSPNPPFPMSALRALLLVGASGFLLVCISACTASDSGSLPRSTPPDSLKSAVTDVVTTVDMMRESLALTIDSTETVDATTFGRVCKPVGQRARAFASSRGWAFQQLADKFRNPSHAPDPQAERIHDIFEASPDVEEKWRRATLNGTQGWRYFRRITVQRSCLACHGAKDKRPAFVKAGYPDDRAYGFAPGDLRGMYAVFVPDSVSGVTSGATPGAAPKAGAEAASAIRSSGVSPGAASASPAR